MDKKNVIEMLNIPEESGEWDSIIKSSYDYCRNAFGNKGYIFAQIGLNNAPCSGKCRFCSLAEGGNIFTESTEKSTLEVMSLVGQLKYVSDLFLMTTADYSFKKVINLACLVRKSLPQEKNLVANIGDFDLSHAKQLKDAGFSGVYHIKRLREGIDTAIDPKTRENTINAAIKAGLDIYYCIEPIGAEHTAQEIADMIEYASTLNIRVMAAMRRVSVPGTPLFARGEVSERRLTQITAVTALAIKPTISMNAHEPCKQTLQAGVNQLYAEFGLNPRDISAETSSSRGLSIQAAKNMLEQHGLTISAR